VPTARQLKKKGEAKGKEHNHSNLLFGGGKKKKRKKKTHVPISKMVHSFEGSEGGGGRYLHCSVSLKGKGGEGGTSFDTIRIFRGEGEEGKGGRSQSILFV